jgi:hypothetical protein
MQHYEEQDHWEVEADHAVWEAQEGQEVDQYRGTDLSNQ